MSAGYLSNLLVKKSLNFESEFNEVYVSGLASSPWQHLDQTSARVKGVNHTTNIICHQLYTVYSTTLRKERLSVLGVLQNNQELQFIVSPLTYLLLDKFNVPLKWSHQIQRLPQEIALNGDDFNSLLNQPSKLCRLSTSYQDFRGSSDCFLSSAIPDSGNKNSGH